MASVDDKVAVGSCDGKAMVDRRTVNANGDIKLLTDAQQQKSDEAKANDTCPIERIHLLNIPIGSMSALAWITLFGAFIYCVGSAHLTKGYWYLLEREPNATGASKQCPNRVSLQVLSVTQTITSLVPGKWFWRLAMLANFFYTSILTPEMFLRMFLHPDAMKASSYAASTYTAIVKISARSLQAAILIMAPTSICYDIQVPTADSPPRFKHRQPEWIDTLHFSNFYLMSLFCLIWNVSYLLALFSIPVNKMAALNIGHRRKMFFLITMVISVVAATVFLTLHFKTCINYCDGIFALTEMVYFTTGVALILDFGGSYTSYTLKITMQK